MESEIKALKEQVDQMEAKLDAIHTLMTEANGVRKAVSLLITLSKVGAIAAIIAGVNWLSAKFGLQ